MSVSSINISQETITRYEEKIKEGKKRLKSFEKFLEHLTPKVKCFETEEAKKELYPRFIHIVRHTKLSNEKLYSDTLLILRKSLGLPQTAFDGSLALISKNDRSKIFCSKELLTIFFPTITDFLNVPFSDECQKNEIKLPLSKEVIVALVGYLYEEKLNPLSIEHMIELMNFAHMTNEKKLLELVIEKTREQLLENKSKFSVSQLNHLLNFSTIIEDVILEDIVKQIVFDCYIEEKNHNEFDEIIMKKYAKEFTEIFFEKYGIKSNYSGTKLAFVINTKDFYSLFTKKESKLLCFIAKQINTIEIEKDDYSSAFLIPKKFRRTIVKILPKKLPKNPEELIQCFSNAHLLLNESAIREVFEKNNTAFNHYLLACVIQDQSEKTAIELLEEAIKLDSKKEDPDKCAWPYAQLGIIYCLQGKLDEAEMHAKKASEIDPKNAPAYLTLADVALSRKELEKSKQYILKALELNPKDASAHFLHAKLWMELKNFDEAEKSARMTIELQPKNPEAHILLGEILSHRNEIDSKCSYKDALELLPVPTSGDQYEKKGILHLKLDELDNAEKEFRKAIELNPKRTCSTHGWLGVTLVKQGKLSEASAELYMAINKNEANTKFFQEQLDKVIEESKKTELQVEKTDVKV